MRRWLAVVALLGFLPLFGCGTLSSLPEPLGGTRKDLSRIGGSSRGRAIGDFPVGPVDGAIDLPFSLVADIVLLPVTLIFGWDTKERDMPDEKGVPPNPWLPKETGSDSEEAHSSNG